MKIILFFLALAPQMFQAQLYERTGKNFGLYFSGSTSLQYRNTNFSKELTMKNLSLGLTHMLVPGIYPKIGYGYSTLSSGLNRNSLSVYHAHNLETSLLFDKSLFKLVRGRFVRNACHYVSIGLIGAPEFRLQFSGNSATFNRYEASGLLGLSFTHVAKNRGRAAMARTQQLDIFVRRGFTPTATLQYNEQMLTYRRLEVGVQLRFVFHQVNSFVPQRGRRR